MNRQIQVIIQPESATFAELHIKTDCGVAVSSHYGEVSCPFCSAKNILAGPAKGFGLAWAFNPCEHNTGAVAGAGWSSTFIFQRGVR